MHSRLFSALLGLACLLPLSGHADNALVKLSPAQMKAMGIATQPLSGFAAGGERRLPAQAVVPPRQVEVLAAPLPGLVVAVETAYGESVKKGQPLVRLRSTEALTLKREYLQARSQARLAAETLKRDQSLFDAGIVAGARLSATAAHEREAAAHYQEKRQALKLLGLGEASAEDMSDTLSLAAPFDGVILESATQAGQRIEANTPLLRLGRIDSLWLEIQASPAQAAGLAVGDRVTVPGCPQPGKLALVAPALNAASQTLLLRAEMPKSGTCLRPFQYTQAEISPARAASGWQVPNAALTRHQGQSWLFVETPGGYRPTPVRVTDETEKTALVTTDLPADAKIVVRGLATLKAVWLGLGAESQPH